MFNKIKPITEHKYQDVSLPKVSVFSWVYNNKDFIRESIESILMQKTNFKVEIIIHDDASNDGTKEIILEYEEKYPHLFSNILHTENQWGQGKSVMTPLGEKPKGKYIALIHGDDYWTDPYKLQKQVDFLEANTDYVLSFHKIKILKPNGELVDDFITDVPENYESQETLAREGNYIHTPSVVFRNVIQEFPPEFVLSPIGDFFLYMLLTEHGKLKYFQEEMAVYRDGVGVWSSESILYRGKKFNYTLLLLARIFKNENSEIYNILIKRLEEFILYCWIHLDEEDLTDFFGNDEPSVEIRYNCINHLIKNVKSSNIKLEQLKLESKNKIKTIKAKDLFLELVHRFKITIWRMLKFQ